MSWRKKLIRRGEGEVRPSIEKWVEAGTILFRAGDPCQAVVLIHEGEVELVEEFGSGTYRLGKRGAGSYIGDGMTLAEGVWSYAARALTPTRLEMIAGPAFLERNEQGPALVSRDRRLPEGIVPLRQPDNAARPVFSPVVHLDAASPASARAMPAEGIEITRFPFNVGRMSSDGPGEGAKSRSSLLIEDRQPYHLSRRQFAIVRMGTQVALSDIGSRLGTFVDGRPIGASPFPLPRGEAVEISAGGASSPFRFRLKAD